MNQAQPDKRNKTGFLVSIDSPIGAGPIVINLANLLKDALALQFEVEAHHSHTPSLHRSIMTGRTDLAMGHDLEEFSPPTFLFNAASKSAVIQLIGKGLVNGNFFICKNFFDCEASSDASLFGPDWRDWASRTKALSKLAWSGPGRYDEILPDLAVYIDMPAAYARKKAMEMLNGSGNDSLLHGVNADLKERILEGFETFDFEGHCERLKDLVKSQENHLRLEYDLTPELMLEYLTNSIKALS